MSRRFTSPHHGRATTIAALSTVLFLAIAGPALAATPTAPPPVTVLTTTAHTAPGDIFITPTGDTTTYANGPEILDRQRQGGLVPPGPRRARARPTSAPRPTTASPC